MKHAAHSFTQAAILFAIIFAVAACDGNDGPLEKAGQGVDNAATDLGNKIEDACEGIKKDLNSKDTDC